MVQTRSQTRAAQENRPTYWKIIGDNFGHFPYHIGINSLEENGETFDARPICGAGGLFFTDIEHIFAYLQYGNRLCEVLIPEDACVVKVEGKYKADKIEIVKIVKLTPTVIRQLIEKGANVHVGDNIALRWYMKYGNLAAVKVLVEGGANVHIWDDHLVRIAHFNGHSRVAAYLRRCP